MGGVSDAIEKKTIQRQCNTRGRRSTRTERGQQSNIPKRSLQGSGQPRMKKNHVQGRKKGVEKKKIRWGIKGYQDCESWGGRPKKR